MISNQADCPCGASKLEMMMSLIDKKLSDAGALHLKAIKFDLVRDINMDEMMLLIAYKRAFQGKASLCTGCFASLPIETICSKILTLLYK